MEYALFGMLVYPLLGVGGRAEVLDVAEEILGMPRWLSGDFVAI